MRKGPWVIALLLATMLIMQPACKAPAVFEVLSLDIEPPEVSALELTTVTAHIKNVGGSEGIYTAVLTIDGTEEEKKNITVAPGAAEKIAFSLSKDKPGTYNVDIGGLSSSLVVKPRAVAKEIELRHDDGVAESVFFAGPDGGHLIRFSPPVIPFTIKKLKICGGLYGAGWEKRRFEVHIWDQDSKTLWTANYPFTEFYNGSLGQWAKDSTDPQVKSVRWLELEVPSVEVAQDFFVHVYTDSRFFREPFGIGIAVDRSDDNKGSEGTLKYEIRWAYPVSKDTVNWMIRVVGTVMAPEE